MREAEQGAPAEVRSQVHATTRAPASVTSAPGRITRRALLLGALAIFANAAWVAYMEPIKAAGRTTIFSLFFASVFTLLLLVAVNAGLRRRWPRRVFSQAELLTVHHPARPALPRLHRCRGRGGGPAPVDQHALARIPAPPRGLRRLQQLERQRLTAKAASLRNLLRPRVAG